MKTIDSFSGKYRFLSNFYSVDIMYEGGCFKSVEHAYQAAKTLDINDRKRICLAYSPAEAKKLGKKVKLRDDWEDIKLKVMCDLLKLKFKHKDLREKLLNTGDAELIEGNWWGDKFWGVCRGEGENHLGYLLMKIRQEIVEKRSQRKSRRIK